MNNRWTEEQLGILKNKYATSSPQELVDLLYPFSKEEINHKASKLKIKKQPSYTIQQLEFLKENYENMPTKEISKIIGKTESSIVCKASRMGLKSRIKWSDDEVQLLNKIYDKYPNKILVGHFTNRSEDTIQVIARKLGLKKTQRFTKMYSEEILLQKLKDFADILGHTPSYYDVVNNKDMPAMITYDRYFGTYRKALKLADLEIRGNLFGKKYEVYYSKDGDICFSQAERHITDFFIDNNISFTKEELYADIIKDDRCGKKRCDWLLKGSVIVEYWGLEDKPKYKISMNEKRSICKDNNIKLIELDRNNIKKLDKIFKN